jgi:hypothetical protein
MLRLVMPLMMMVLKLQIKWMKLLWSWRPTRWFIYYAPVIVLVWDAIASTLPPWATWVDDALVILAVVVLLIGLARRIGLPMIIRSRLSDDLLAPFRSVYQMAGNAFHRTLLAGVVPISFTTSLLVLGQTGSGKTETIKTLLRQDDLDRDTPIIAFDYKSDMSKDVFGDRDTLHLSLRDSDVQWSMFAEAENEDDLAEVSRAVFDSDDGDYFESAARQVFEGALISLDQQDDFSTATNADVQRLLDDVDEDKLRQILEHNGQESAARQLPDGSDRQAAGVLSTMSARVSDLLRGDFATDGTWSIRDYLDNPRGRVLVLDLPPDASESVLPMFRLVLDWAIRQGLRDDQEVVFVLDEFAALPELEMMERLVNAGRARNCRAVLGVQSIAQLRKTYGREGADALLSGCAEEILLRPGDQASVDYIRDEVGQTQIRRDKERFPRLRRIIQGDFWSRHVEWSSEEHPIGEDEIRQFEPGEAIAVVPDGWVWGQLYQWGDLKRSLSPTSNDDLDQDHSVDVETDSNQTAEKEVV